MFRRGPISAVVTAAAAVSAGAAPACAAEPVGLAFLGTTLGLVSLGAFLLASAALTVVVFRRRRAERERVRLKNESDCLAASFAAGRAASFTLDARERLVPGPGLEALAGAPADKTWTLPHIGAIFDTAGAPGFVAAVQALQQTGQSFVLTLRGADGQRLYRVLGRRHDAGAAALDAVWLQDATDTLAALIRHEREVLRLRGLVDALPLPVWARDATLKVLDCNAAYAEAVEAKDRAAALAEAREIAEGAGAEAARSLARRAVESGKPQMLQQHIVVEGARRLFEITETPLPGRLTAGYAMDVTRLEESRTAIARHTSAHNEVLERLAIAIAMVGPEGNIRFFNGAFARLWGLNETWLESRPHLAEMLDRLREHRMLPETGDFAGLRRQWTGWITGLMEPRQELLHLPNGMAIWMVVSPHPLGGLVFTFENVTYRLALERSVNTLAAVQRDTLDHLYEGVAVFGEDGVLKLSNPAFRRMWSLSEAFAQSGPHIGALLDQARDALPVARNWDKVRPRVMSRVTNRRLRSGRIRRTDGTVVTYALVPLPDGGILASFRDITDTVKVAQALRERAEALEAADRIKAEFIANISYELRTPLNAIIGFTEILNNRYFGPLNDRQAEYTAGVLEASQRLLSLINDILDLAVIEAGRMVLDIEPVAVRSVAESVVQLTGEWAREQGLRLETEVPADIGLIEADERRLKHALFNLISNAIKFTPPGGRIRLTATRHADQLAFAVEDTGMGIPDEDRERVFEKFVRGRTHDGRVPGAGLGLSLVKSLVELHGGRLELSSTPGQGTRVTCWLPVRSKVQPLPGAKHPPVSPQIGDRGTPSAPPPAESDSKVAA